MEQHNLQERLLLSISPTAKHYIKEKLATQEKKYAFLSIKGGGCAGFEYTWDFTNSEDDGVLIEDVLVVDKIAELHILGSEVDYVQEFSGSQLVIRNPNASMSCGCGESFSV